MSTARRRVTRQGRFLAPAASLSPVLVRMSDVEPERVMWLWEHRIPRGKLTLAEGNPGNGKTFGMLAVSASLTRGWPLPGPDGVPRINGIRLPETALLLTCEDGLADTIRPRLDAAKADVTKVYALDGAKDAAGKRQPFTLADVEMLDKALIEVKPALVIIDPIQGFLGATVDMHRANEVRPLLSGLATLAEKHGCAVVAIRHLRKSSSDHATQRGLGSIDFSAAARSILLFAQNPIDPHQYIIAHTKSSLAPRCASVAFTLEGGEFAWAGASSLSADDLLRPPEKPESRPQDEVSQWLLEQLADGPVAVPDLESAAQAAGHQWRTVHRRKNKLGVIPRKHGMGGGWTWELPTERDTPAHVETSSSTSPSASSPADLDRGEL